MNWQWILLIIALIYIGIDYGRLIVKSRRLEDLVGNSIEYEEYTPTMYIMVGAQGSEYIADLSMMDVKAHQDVGVGISVAIVKEEQGYTKSIFENGDILVVYCYEKAQFAPLTRQERERYAMRLFFDYKLPIGAERAVIEQLGLLDHMIDIGICSEKSGGK